MKMQAPIRQALDTADGARPHDHAAVNLPEGILLQRAQQVAQGLASMIDGFYIRRALQDRVPDQQGIRQLVQDYLELWLERENRIEQSA